MTALLQQSTPQAQCWAHCLDCKLPLRSRDAWAVEGGHVCDEHKISRMEIESCELESSLRQLDWFTRR